MKQQTQLAQDLYQLAIEIVEYMNASERALAPRDIWNNPHGSFPDVDAGLQKLNRFTEEIRKHPGFVWLAKKSDFNDALQFFEEEIRKIEDSELEIARMKTHLLHAIAGSGWQLLDDSSWTPKKISKKEKENAVNRANELLTFVKDGLGRPDYPVMQNLAEPLTQFIHHMQMDTKREYSGPSDRQKEIAINFALGLRYFGLKQSKVGELLKSAFLIFDFDLGDRSAQRYVSEAFTR